MALFGLGRSCIGLGRPSVGLGDPCVGLKGPVLAWPRWPCVCLRGPYVGLSYPMSNLGSLFDLTLFLAGFKRLSLRLGGFSSLVISKNYQPISMGQTAFDSFRYKLPFEYLAIHKKSYMGVGGGAKQSLFIKSLVTYCAPYL